MRTRPQATAAYTKDTEYFENQSHRRKMEGNRGSLERIEVMRKITGRNSIDFSDSHIHSS